jgi:hypothetical protein
MKAKAYVRCGDMKPKEWNRSQVAARFRVARRAGYRIFRFDSKDGYRVYQTTDKFDPYLYGVKVS